MFFLLHFDDLSTGRAMLIQLIGIESIIFGLGMQKLISTLSIFLNELSLKLNPVL